MDIWYYKSEETRLTKDNQVVSRWKVYKYVPSEDDGEDHNGVYWYFYSLQRWCMSHRKNIHELEADGLISISKPEAFTIILLGGYNN